MEGPLTRPRFAFGDLRPVIEPLVAAYAEEHLSDDARKQLEKAIDASGLEDELSGGKAREERGAKGAKKDKAKSKKGEKRKAKAKDDDQDKARREIEKRLPEVLQPVL